MSRDERLLELISALVDGELSPDEQARAEQLLASSADLRRYRDELLNVRTAVQNLPRYRLPDTFAQQVLRRAEREMLSAAPALTPSEQATSAARPPRSSRRRIVPWLATVAAVAAAIALIVVLQPGRRAADLADRNSPEQGAPETTIAADTPVGPSRTIEQQEADPDPAANLAQSRPQDSDDQRVSSEPESNQNDSQSTPGGVLPGDNPQLVDATPATDTADPAQLQMPMYAYVLEVVLTTQGIQDETFNKALARSGISLRNAIPVDRSMESTLLAHKYFGGVRPEDLPADGLPYDPDPIRDYLQIVFLVCTGPQFDQMSKDLSEQPGYVIAVKHDFASATSDMMLYSQMQKLAQNESPGGFVGAHPLAIEEKLRERLLVALQESKSGKETAVEPPRQPMPPLPSPDAPAPAETEQQPAAADWMAELEEMQHMVLIVLRSADTVQP